MRKLTLSTVCMFATLAAMPALGAPAGKQEQRPGNPECTHVQGEPRSRSQASRQSNPKYPVVDCIVVKGNPNQDGRAVLRRSLQDEAKQGLSKVVRPTLRDIFGKDRTS